MSILLNILLTASFAVTTVEQRHIDAVEIFYCDFGPSWDVNFDKWPDLWTRVHGRSYPHYVQIQLEQDESAVENTCLTVRLNGGGALVVSPAIAVSDKFSYVVEAKLRALDVEHCRTRVKVEFCDEKRQVLETHTSRWYGNTDGWESAQIGPLNIAHPEARLAMISLEIEPGKQVDLRGKISLDDVWLARLPRMSVRTNSAFNVYTNPKSVIVTCDLSGIRDQDPDIRFELLDASSLQIEDSIVRLQGRLITERLSKASDIIESSVELPAGYSGSTQWQPPIKEYGFYRVRVSMQTSKGTLKEEMISIAVVPPIQSPARGEFGWSLLGQKQPLDFEQLNGLLPLTGIRRVKLPLWYDESEPDRGDQLIRFAEQLAAHDIDIVGVLDRPPHVAEPNKQLSPDVAIADVLTNDDESVWLPSLDAVLTRLSLRVRWWQLGHDYDTSFSHIANLEERVSNLREKLFRFGQDVRLGIGWSWNELAVPQQPATWNFQQMSATPALTESELETYLNLPDRQGVQRWVLVEPLQKDIYDLETRAQDLVQQMITAKIHGADAIFAAKIFDDEFGLMTSEGAPGELLLPWRTTASLLSGTKFIGSIQLPGGSNNRLFEAADGNVVMVVWNQLPQQEVLQLGEKIQAVDVWGRTSQLSKVEDRHVLEVSSLPQFILGVNQHLAKWNMNTSIVTTNVPSVFGVAHPNQIEFRNPFNQGAGGTVRLVAPEGWQILPDRIDFKLASGELARRPFHIVLPHDADSGTATVKAEFDFSADTNYHFTAFREVTVGDEDIHLELSTRLEEDGTLIVEQRMINYADELTDFKCFLYAPGRRRQKMHVFRLGNNFDVKTYVYSYGVELLGEELWLRAEEVDGTRVFNHRITVEQ